VARSDNIMLLFAKHSDPATASIVEDLRKVAADHKSDFKFVVVDPENQASSRIVGFFGIKETELPDARLILMEPSSLVKYKQDKLDVTEAGVRSFVSDFLANKLTPFLMSEEVPADWDAQPVKVLVGKNHDKVVNDPTKNVLVEYYAPWCGHCKHLAPIYEQLATELKDQTDVVVAKMDSTVNEIEGLNVVSFPTLKFYHASNGEKTPIDYEGERTLEDLKLFVKTNKIVVASQTKQAMKEDL